MPAFRTSLLDPRFFALCPCSLQVLRKLNKYPFAARHYGLYTTADGKLQVLAMQLLGNSISALRRKQVRDVSCVSSRCWRYSSR